MTISAVFCCDGEHDDDTVRQLQDPASSIAQQHLGFKYACHCLAEAWRHQLF